MTEIHEPMRTLFVIESTELALRRIISENEGIARLVHGDWVQIAIFNPATSQMRRLVGGEFVPYVPESHEIPSVVSSIDWYHDQRDHLGFASITPTSDEAAPTTKGKL